MSLGIEPWPSLTKLIAPAASRAMATGRLRRNCVLSLFVV